MQNSSERSTTIIRAVFFIAILAISCIAVIALKHETDEGPLTPEGLAHRDSLRNIAKPDISPTPEQAQPTQQQRYQAAEDSITLDLRTPADAGYEDGYYAGIADGVNGEERASYDESSQFPDPAQRRNYAEAYRRGYAQGYNDSLEGKQFGVVNDDDTQQLDEEQP